MVFKKTKTCSSKFDPFEDENLANIRPEVYRILEYLGLDGQPLINERIELGYAQPVRIVAMMATVEETEEVAEGSAENDVGLRPPEGNIRTTLENSEPRTPAAGEQAQTVGSSRSERPSTAADGSSGQSASEATQGPTAQPRQVRRPVFTVPPGYYTRPRRPPSPVEHWRTPQVFFPPSRPLPRRRREPQQPTPPGEEPPQAVNSAPTTEEPSQVVNSAPASEMEPAQDEVEVEEEIAVAEEEEIANEEDRDDASNWSSDWSDDEDAEAVNPWMFTTHGNDSDDSDWTSDYSLHGRSFFHDDSETDEVDITMESMLSTLPSPGLLVRDQFTQSSFPSEPSPSTTWALDEYLDDIEVYIRGSSPRNVPWMLEVPERPVLERRHSI
ncbi:hypothetical protein ACEPAG_3181 [Sanghuangporus baumii]